jgi:hypothetical protein
VWQHARCDIKDFIIPYLYETRHVSGDISPVIRSLNCTGSLWFFIRVVGGRCQAQYNVPDNVHQLHVQQPSTYEKPEAASAVLGSWWRGGVSPETCRASYKYGIIKFWYIVASWWIFLYELYGHICKTYFIHNFSKQFTWLQKTVFVAFYLNETIFGTVSQWPYWTVNYDYVIIYLITAIGLTRGGSNTVHIYT